MRCAAGSRAPPSGIVPSPLAHPFSPAHLPEHTVHETATVRRRPVDDRSQFRSVPALSAQVRRHAACCDEVLRNADVETISRADPGFAGDNASRLWAEWRHVLPKRPEIRHAVLLPNGFAAARYPARAARRSLKALNGRREPDKKKLGSRHPAVSASRANQRRRGLLSYLHTPATQAWLTLQRLLQLPQW